MANLDSGSHRDSPIFDEMSDTEVDDSSSKKRPFLAHQIIKHNNNNFNIKKNCNDNYIHGNIRGRKTFAFWTLVFLLLFLALSNLILTLTILGVLRLGYGMSSLELVPEASAIKFFGNTDLGHLYKVDGKINGFLDVPVTINGEENGSLLLDLIGRSGRPVNKLTINRNGTIFQNIGSFVVNSATGNHHTFSSNNPFFTLQNGADKMITKLSHTNRIVSLYNRSLELKADTSINLKGTEGTRMETKQSTWSADQDILLESLNGSIIFNGKNGISLDVKNMPKSHRAKGDAMTAHFKICVCVPHGKLFKIRVSEGQYTRINCNHISMAPSHNPCM